MKGVRKCYGILVETTEEEWLLVRPRSRWKYIKMALKE
jgi:hypothetical protein